MLKISLEDCSRAEGSEYDAYCKEIVALDEKYDDIQTQIYIISGAIGGVLLILFILVITLFVKFNRSFKRVNDGDELAKRGFSTYTGQAAPAATVNPTVAPSPTPFTPATPNSHTFGYDNATFEQQSATRPNGHPHTNNAGGVRVLPTLPRNPPILRTLNQQNQQNQQNHEDYY